MLMIPQGCAPAMINCNLSGDALLHCLKISRATIFLTDDEDACKARVMGEKQRIEAELAITIIELSTDLKTEIAAKDAPRTMDDYRKDVTGSSPMSIIYTRYVFAPVQSIRLVIVIDEIVFTVVPQASQKAALLLWSVCLLVPLLDLRPFSYVMAPEVTDSTIVCRSIMELEVS